MAEWVLGAERVRSLALAHRETSLMWAERTAAASPTATADAAAVKSSAYDVISGAVAG